MTTNFEPNECIIFPSINENWYIVPTNLKPSAVLRILNESSKSYFVSLYILVGYFKKVEAQIIYKLDFIQSEKMQTFVIVNFKSWCWKLPGHHLFTPKPGRLDCVISIQKGVKSDAYPVTVSKIVTKNFPVSFHSLTPGFK